MHRDTTRRDAAVWYLGVMGATRGRGGIATWRGKRRAPITIALSLPHRVGLDDARRGAQPRLRTLLPAGGVGRCWTGDVMGNVHAVDSYCFVIGPCNRDALPSDAAPNIARRSGGRFIGNFPRPTSGFPRFSRSCGRDDACQRGAFPRSLSPGTRFCAFFFRPFCILFFFSEWCPVKSGASE